MLGVYSVSVPSILGECSAFTRGVFGVYSVSARSILGECSESTRRVFGDALRVGRDDGFVPVYIVVACGVVTFFYAVD